jgi:DDE_Tnp_1-associated
MARTRPPKDHRPAASKAHPVEHLPVPFPPFQTGTGPSDHMGVNAYDPSGSVPAPTSSRVPTAPQRPVAPVALALAQCRDLLGYLATITDPRQRRGRRHTLAAVLAVAVAAVLAGARSLAAIGEWAADAPGPVLAALGVRRDPLRRVWRPPDEATVRRVLARVDPDALDLAIGRWLADQDQPRPSQPHSARRRRGAGRSRLTARRSAAPDATAARCTCWRRWTTLKRFARSGDMIGPVLAAWPDETNRLSP